MTRGAGTGGLRSVLVSSHRATGWNLEKSCLQLLRGVVVDGWFSVLSARRPKALQATPLQSVKRNLLAVAATTKRSPPAIANFRRLVVERLAIGPARCLPNGGKRGRTNWHFRSPAGKRSRSIPTKIAAGSGER